MTKDANDVRAAQTDAVSTVAGRRGVGLGVLAVDDSAKPGP